jgi:hypothetical protein
MAAKMNFLRDSCGRELLVAGALLATDPPDEQEKQHMEIACGCKL